MIALITGITGQDGSYLAELLLEKGYEVHGIIRRSSSFNTGRIDHIINNDEFVNKFFFHHGDVTDASNLNRILETVQPNEIYNLAAQSHVQVSFEMPDYTAQVDALGTLRFLDAIRETALNTKFYQASTSELFGKVQEVPQNEKTPFYPRSPYAVAKMYAYWITVNYREAYGMHASNGILFNHESPIRGETFVTRKITRAVSRIALGLQEKVFLGNLSSKRDWGHAKDYVKGMYLILQQEEPDDYVLATGVTTEIREFIRMAFSEIGLEIAFLGQNVDEKGYLVGIDEKVFTNKVGEQYFKNIKSKVTPSLNHPVNHSQIIVDVDPRYFRPTEVDLLIGNPTKAYEKLGWKPEYDLKCLVEDMMQSDIQLMKKERYLREGGFRVMNYFE